VLQILASNNIQELAEGVRAGDVRAIAKLITLVEEEPKTAPAVIDAIGNTPSGKPSHVVGIAGAPGIGKSTLIDKLAEEYRRRNRTVGILAVDPTSPFTGGAVLGDRSRMNRLSSDKGIYIRSMGTRGEMGGLSRAVHDAIKILMASQKEVILVETTGVGQNEVEIINAVHTVVVLMMPGLGDEVQLIESGMPEIGDVFVLNKSDMPGADHAAAEIRSIVRLRSGSKRWSPPVIKTVGLNGEGVPELADAIDGHRVYLEETGELLAREKRAYISEVLNHVKLELTQLANEALKNDSRIINMVNNGFKENKNSYDTSKKILTLLLNKNQAEQVNEFRIMRQPSK
jgi:LAO/AO transport system kinase